MAHAITAIEHLVVVRWGVPSHGDCDQLSAELTDITAQAEQPLFSVLVLPYDLPALKDDERAFLSTAIDQLLPHSARVAVVVEARGFRGAILRSCVTQARLAGSRRADLRVVDSVANALAQAPGPLPHDHAVGEALRELGCSLPPGLRVA